MVKGVIERTLYIGVRTLYIDVRTLYICVCMDVCGEGSSIDIKQEPSLVTVSKETYQCHKRPTSVCGEGRSIDIKQEGSGGRGRESGGNESRHWLVVGGSESFDF